MNSSDQNLDDEEALFISFKTNFKLTRIVENLVIPSQIELRADVNPNEGLGETDLSNIINKVKFWFDNLVTRSIVFSSDNSDAISMVIDETGKNRSSNVLMIVPGEPTDDMLAAVFSSKLNALGENLIDFGLVEIKSDNPVGLSFTFVGNACKVLPTMTEWMGDRNYFDKPWWNRDDASTLDIIPPEDADLSEKPKWAYSLDNIKKTKTDVIIKPFKPTIIDGGKKKD